MSVIQIYIFNTVYYNFLRGGFFTNYVKNDKKYPMDEFEGQTVLGHHGPSPPACFGSIEWFESSLVTAETGGRA